MEATRRSLTSNVVPEPQGSYSPGGLEANSVLKREEIELYKCFHPQDGHGHGCEAGTPRGLWVAVRELEWT